MKPDPFLDILKDLLKDSKAHTQEELCQALQQQGHTINQSKISRLLRKIGAIKIVNAEKGIVYSLPREPTPPSMDTALHQLVLGIETNEVLIVIFTLPGSASMIARLLDHNQASAGILGTLAGDDTIFVTPKSIKEIKKVTQNIRALLMKVA